MANINYAPYEFTINGFSKDKFKLISFNAELAISTLFSVEVLFASDDKNLNLNSLILKQATIKIASALDDRSFSYLSGVILSISAVGTSFGFYTHKVVIVPSLKVCDINRYCRIYQNQSIKNIIEDIFSKNSIANFDIKFDNSALFAPLDYVCQYNESDFNFISRLMEQVGVYYYFEFLDSIDKVVITDSKIAQKELSPDKYDVSDATEVIVKERIKHCTLTYNAISGSYQLRNFSSTFNNMSLEKKDAITSKSKFLYYEYGGNAKLQALFSNISQIESERLKVDGIIANGTSSIRRLNPGFMFTIANHPIPANNQKYLVTKLSIKAEQSSFVNQNSQEPMYINSFELIPADVQFRPKLKTPKPTINGILCASIDAEGDTTPMLDTQGRYKVLMPFDSSDPNPGKASCWIKMMQPSAAPNGDRGFHFSLLGKDEVAIGFIEGDIDRPVILGALSSKNSVVTSANLMQDRIVTLGGHEIIFDNTVGKECVFINYGKGTVKELIGLS